MNSYAVPASRPPPTHDAISFVSASSAVHVHTEPSPFSFCSWEMFLSLPPTKDQISSHWRRLQGRSRRCSSWYFVQAAPSSASSLTTVFFDAPVMRTVDLM